MSVVRGIRRTAIVAIVVSLVLAAILGIVALLSGEFGETQNKILFTTLTVAAFGTTALCHLAVVARAVRFVGFAGLAASAGAALCSFVLIWGDWSGYEWQAPWVKALSVLAILAISLAQANLLLLLAARPQLLIGVALGVTLVAIAVVAVMYTIPILTDYEIPGMNDADTYWRWLGVAAILDVLGTIACRSSGSSCAVRPPRSRSFCSSISAPSSGHVSTRTRHPLARLPSRSCAGSSRRSSRQPEPRLDGCAPPVSPSRSSRGSSPASRDSRRRSRC
jgi:hypothetical protein